MLLTGHQAHYSPQFGAVKEAVKKLELLYARVDLVPHSIGFETRLAGEHGKTGVLLYCNMRLQLLENFTQQGLT